MNTLKGLGTVESSHPSLFPDHGKVKFIFVAIGGLLPEAGQPVLLRVVVAGPLDIIFVFFKDTEFRAVG